MTFHKPKILKVFFKECPVPAKDQQNKTEFCIEGIMYSLHNFPEKLSELE